MTMEILENMLNADAYYINGDADLWYGIDMCIEKGCPSDFFQEEVVASYKNILDLCPLRNHDGETCGVVLQEWHEPYYDEPGVLVNVETVYFSGEEMTALRNHVNNLADKYKEATTWQEFALIKNSSKVNEENSPMIKEAIAKMYAGEFPMHTNLVEGVNVFQTQNFLNERDNILKSLLEKEINKGAINLFEIACGPTKIHSQDKLADILKIPLDDDIKPNRKIKEFLGLCEQTVGWQEPYLQRNGLLNVNSKEIYIQGISEYLKHVPKTVREHNFMYSGNMEWMACDAKYKAIAKTIGLKAGLAHFEELSDKISNCYEAHSDSAFKTLEKIIFNHAQELSKTELDNYRKKAIDIKEFTTPTGIDVEKDDLYGITRFSVINDGPLVLVEKLKYTTRADDEDKSVKAYLMATDALEMALDMVRIEEIENTPTLGLKDIQDLKALKNKYGIGEQSRNQDERNMDNDEKDEGCL